MRYGRAMKVDFVVVGLPSWINLDSVAPSGYKSKVSLLTGGIVDGVDMSLIDCAKLGKSSLEDVVSRLRSFVTLRASKVGFS